MSGWLTTTLIFLPLAVALLLWLLPVPRLWAGPLATLAALALALAASPLVLAAAVRLGLPPFAAWLSHTHGVDLTGLEPLIFSGVILLHVPYIFGVVATLLLLDEPTEGLAPVIVQQIGAVVRQLKERGYTVLLVEQNFYFASTVADRHYLIEHGRVVDMIDNAQLDESMDKLHEYLGV